MSSVRLVIENVSDMSVTIRREVTPADTVPEEGAQGLGADENILKTGVSDEKLDLLFAHGESVEVTGDKIAELALLFQGRWKDLISGETEKFFEKHRVFKDAELLLTAYAEKQAGGTGVACARAEVWAGGRRYPAAGLSRAISPKSGFVRADAGWFSVQTLRKLGLGRMGRLTNGRSIEKPYVLTADELLNRGSVRLSGPWKRMAAAGPPRSRPEMSTAFGHLCYLAGWGICGGLIGMKNSVVTAFVKFVLEQRRDFPQCRILAVGRSQRLEALSEALEPALPLVLGGGTGENTLPVGERPLILASPDAVATDGKLPQISFDLLFLIEPDLMTATNSTRNFWALYRLRARVRIALYADSGFTLSPATCFPQFELLGIQFSAVTGLLVIDPEKPLPPLPRPYSFSEGTTAEKPFFTEIDLGAGQTVRRGTAVPKEPGLSRAVGGAPPENLRVRTGDQYFLDQARKLSGRMQKSAQFVPFSTYWPTYGAMTAQQSQWYFYWRGVVRKGGYPRSDLSYILLYVYELINMVGCTSPSDGLRKLIGVWRAYRDAFPALDKYLADWVSDFRLVYGVEPEAGEMDGLPGRASGVADIDALLLDGFRSRPVDIDFELLPEVSDYNILSSRFYNSRGGKLCRAYIPKVIALVDAFIEKREGQRIIELFDPGCVKRERYLFRSALFAGERRTAEIESVPVSTHPPLRDFMARIIRRAENKLRAMTGFHGRLRGMALDDELGRLIDVYLERELLKKKPKARQTVQINQEKLARATSDAAETRRMLMDGQIPDTAGEEPVHEQAESDGSGGQVSGTADDLFKELDGGGCALVGALVSRGGEVDMSELAGLLPDLMIEEEADRVNEAALDVLGDLLIVAENGRFTVNSDFMGGFCGENANPAHEAEDGGGSWKKFVSHLTSCDTEALLAIAHGEGMAGLERIAVENGAMAELVLDEINEAAVDAFGDIVTDGKTVFGEYMDLVDTLISAGD